MLIEGIRPACAEEYLSAVRSLQDGLPIPQIDPETRGIFFEQDFYSDQVLSFTKDFTPMLGVHENSWDDSKPYAIIIEAGVHIAKGTWIAGNKTRIQSGCEIGAYVQISEGAFLWREAKLKERSSVGPKSWLMAKAQLGIGACVGVNCLISGAKIGDRAIVHDQVNLPPHLDIPADTEYRPKSPKIWLLSEFRYLSAYFHSFRVCSELWFFLFYS